MTGAAAGPARPDGLGAVLAWVLEQSHGASAIELAALIGRAAHRLGIPRTRLYLADIQQQRLTPLPQPDLTAHEREGLVIDGSLAGLTYRTQQVQAARGRGATWFPMIDGIERAGVLHATIPAPDAGLLEAGLALANLATLLVVSMSSPHDLLVQRERARPMTLQAELLWAFLPPRTIGTALATSAAVLEPACDIGGAAFDHSFIDGVLHLTLLDAMGHDLASSGASAVGLAACRSTRRSGGTLTDRRQRTRRGGAGDLGGPAEYPHNARSEVVAAPAAEHPRGQHQCAGPDDGEGHGPGVR